MRSFIRSKIFFEYSLILLLTYAVSLIRGPRLETPDNEHSGSSSTSGAFPIVLPHNELKKDEAGKFYLPADEKNPCLLYMESLSVVLFNVNKKISAWATINSTSEGATYNGAIECPTVHNAGQQFTISLQASVGGSGAPGYYLQDNSKVIFRLQAVDVELVFNFSQSAYWHLSDVHVSKISLSGGDEGGGRVPDVDSSWKPVSGVSSNSKGGWLFTDVQSPAWNINGFKDYSYSCARTSPIVWAKDGENAFAVGLVFNNFQFQLNSIYTDKADGIKKSKFGWRINDCAPLFSIGTWMGVVVVLLLVGVLSFGFLMLNSVQTMDRFDDPKQKQLIISSKEN